MMKSSLAPGNYRVTVNVGQESRGLRVSNGTVHGLEEWHGWEGEELTADTHIVLGGMLAYNAQHIAEVLNKTITGDLEPVIYAGVFETRCTSLEAAVGAALYDMLQTHEVSENGEGFLEDGDLFVLEPPAGQELVTTPCYFIVAGCVHVADTRDVRPEYLRKLLGDRHLPVSAMGTRWLERRSEQAL